MAVLALSTGIMIGACDTRAALRTGTARPVVRMSTAETTILNTFLNLPQFSVQLIDIGDSESG
ncbi:MAG: hypothetical protein ABSB35_10865 [Bryobacteraceae bacterium]